MKAFVTNRKEQLQFFFKVPGHNYFKKLDDLIEFCVTTVGEMFNEYCENESVDPPLVQFQTSTNFQSITIFLWQKHPSQIQTTVKEEKWMIITLEHIYSNSIKRMKSISMIEDSASVQTFCNRYIVEESPVKKYLEHLSHLDIMSENKQMEKKNKNLKENTIS